MNLLPYLLFTAAVSASAAASTDPSEPQKILSPTVLSECGCGGFVNIVQKCQTLDPLSADEGKACICDESAGWYSGSLDCRACLRKASNGETTWTAQLFYEAFGSTITSAYLACTDVTASVKVIDEDNGKGICGWYSVPGWTCVGFDAEKGTGWASLITANTKEEVVGTAEVEIDEVEGAKSTKATSGGVSATATATASASASGTATAAAAANSAAASSVSQETKDPNGAAALRSSLALVGVVALLIAAF